MRCFLWPQSDGLGFASNQIDRKHILPPDQKYVFTVLASEIDPNSKIVGIPDIREQGR